MNFFEGSGLDESPRRKSSYCGKSANQNDFDQLDNLLNEDQRQKKIQPFSTYNTKSQIKPITTTAHWANSNQFTPNFKNYNTSLNQHNTPKRQRHIDSDDNKSVASKIMYNQTQLNDINTIKMNEGTVFNQTTSMRSMMKPPIRKKKQELSIAKDIDSVSAAGNMKDSFGELQSVSILGFKNSTQNEIQQKNQKSALNLKQSLQSRQNKLRELPIQKQLSFRENISEAKKQSEQQLSFVKQSYQRQITLLEEQLRRQTKMANQQRIKLIQQTEMQVNAQKNKWEKIIKEENQRVKDSYQWEIKKKIDTYDIEINHLKSLLETASKHMQAPNFNNLQKEKCDIKIKQSQLQRERNKLQLQKQQFKNQQIILKGQQADFQLYRNRQQAKLQQNRKQIQQMQNQVRKKQMQNKYNITDEKQRAAQEIATLHMDIARQKEQLQREFQSLKMEQELFLKQKMQYEQLNSGIVGEYKQKIKGLQLERQKMAAQQIQLRNRIHTVHAMGAQFQENTQVKGRSKSFLNRKKATSDLQVKLEQSKQRYAAIEQFISSKGTVHGVKTAKLQPFLERMSRNHRKHHV